MTSNTGKTCIFGEINVNFLFTVRTFLRQNEYKCIDILLPMHLKKNDIYSHDLHILKFLCIFAHRFYCFL